MTSERDDSTWSHVSNEASLSYKTSQNNQDNATLSPKFPPSKNGTENAANPSTPNGRAAQSSSFQSALTNIFTFLPLGHGEPATASVPPSDASKWLQAQILDERIAFANLLDNFTHQRKHVMCSFLGFLASTETLYLHFKDLPATGDRFLVELRQAMERAQQSTGILEGQERRLTALTQRLIELESKLTLENGANPVLGVQVKEEGVSGRLETRSPSLSSKNNSALRVPHPVQAYYDLVGDIRNMYDELISIGPKNLEMPALDRQDSPQRPSSNNSRSTTGQDMQQRRAKLLQNIQEAKREAANLKALCLEQNYSLEESSDGGDDYEPALVQALETGPPRIDALLSKSIHCGKDTTRNLEPGGPHNNASIARWATEVDRLGTPPQEGVLNMDQTATLTPIDFNAQSQKDRGSLALNHKRDFSGASGLTLEAHSAVRGPTFFGEAPSRRYSAPETAMLHPDGFCRSCVEVKRTQSQPGSNA